MAEPRVNDDPCESVSPSKERTSHPIQREELSHQIGARPRARASIALRDVLFDRDLGAREAHCDLFVGGSAGQKLEHLDLTLAESPLAAREPEPHRNAVDHQSTSSETARRSEE